MAEELEKDKMINLPVLFLRGLVLFPGMTLNIDVGRLASIEAINYAFLNNKKIFVVTQKDVLEDTPSFSSLNKIGVIAEIKQIIKKDNLNIKVLVNGLERGTIKNLSKNGDFYTSIVLKQNISYIVSNNIHYEIASIRRIKSLFKEYVKLNTQISDEIILGFEDCLGAGQISDYLASNLTFDYNTKQKILNELDPINRLEKLIKVLLDELNILSIEQDINIKLINKLEDDRRESFLREQKKVIIQELGENDFNSEIENIRSKIEDLNLPNDIGKILINECDNLLSLQNESQESSMLLNYLNTCINLPWNKKSEEKIDINYAKKILDKNHYGLIDVKERIVELLAVRKLTKSLKGQIICLVGPTGVGKTSIASSVAEAIGRKYVRIALGGVHDEADIRGHRRTYIGAMPGRIIESLKRAKVKNPVILLDEIDKLSKDAFGDPTSALLEVLDSEQNNSFHDHYLDFPFDLSQVLFIATANSIKNIPLPLIDRMDIIKLSSYSPKEKFNIAKKYLIPKQLKLNGLCKNKLKFTNHAIRGLISFYTKEAGIRNLERYIAKLMRISAKIFITENKKKIVINYSKLESMLGPKKFLSEEIDNKLQVGVSRGLAFTQFGGDLISIEVATMSGNGNLELTGSLGDVMKESAQTAISFIRSNAEKLSIDPEFYKKLDIHIHVPQGAVPKDGPSAGITLATAIVSALTNIPVKQDVVMTGEITLRGRVLPVGGIREKIMAACKADVSKVILPKSNKSDLSGLDPLIQSSFDYILTDNMSSVLKHALNLKSSKLKKKFKF